MNIQEQRDTRRMELTRDDIQSAIARCGRMDDDWNNPNLLAALCAAEEMIRVKIRRREDVCR
jgi:hypothetical protein